MTLDSQPSAYLEDFLDLAIAPLYREALIFIRYYIRDLSDRITF
nr:hypothetical protein [Trichocoleus desertorum]